jgi:hypothetical protein
MTWSYGPVCRRKATRICGKVSTTASTMGSPETGGRQAGVFARRNADGDSPYAELNARVNDSCVS